jgi:sodium/potassium-transporting ATPase subunit alpha
MMTDVAGSVQLVYEKAEGDLMSRPPRDAKTDKLVDARLMAYAFLQLGAYGGDIVMTLT